LNFDTLSIVKFGDVESLNDFLFENGQQHYYFQRTFQQKGIAVPIFPIIDVNTDNLDDWLLAHQVEHQAISGYLGLENPFNMLDVDFNKEEAFYDWVGLHYTIHQQIAATLGLK